MGDERIGVGGVGIGIVRELGWGDERIGVGAVGIDMVRKVLGSCENWDGECEKRGVRELGSVGIGLVRKVLGGCENWDGGCLWEKLGDERILRQWETQTHNGGL